MYLAYCDEQDDHLHRYSAAVACVFRDQDAVDYRKDLIIGLRRIFRRSETDARPFPVLHASELPQELNDKDRISLFCLVLDCTSQYCRAVYRVGYHWSDSHVSGLFSAKGGQQQARIASYSTLQHELSQLDFKPLVFVQEYDKSTHERFSEALNRVENIEQLEQLAFLNGRCANHLSDVLGYHYAPKRDHLLYAVDFVAYLLKIRDEGKPSEFKRKLIASSADFGSLILRDQIVECRSAL